MWNIIKTIHRIDSFLTDCEEYCDTRLWNGKFVYDLKFLSAETIDNTKEDFTKRKAKVMDSPAYKTTVDVLQRVRETLMAIPIIESIILLLIDAFRTIVKNFAHYLVVVIFGLASVTFLISLFTNTPYGLAIFILPVLVANLLLLSGLYIMIDKKAQGTKISIGESFALVKQIAPANTFLFLLLLAITAILVVFMLGFSAVLTVTFDSISINWSGSFFFWLILIIVGLVLLIILYSAFLVIAFACMFVIVDKKSALAAMTRSCSFLLTEPKHSFVFYIIATFPLVHYIVTTTSRNNEGGLGVSVLFSAHVMLLLGYLIRKRYFDASKTSAPSLFERFWMPINGLFGIGLLSYIALAAIFIQLHPDIMRMLEEQRKVVVRDQDFVAYHHNDFGYKIHYPQRWTVYRWEDKSITFYTNRTGTSGSGVWVNIAVYPADNSQYFKLYEASPGLFSYNTGSKDVMTKISNHVIQGENAVKYTLVKTDVKTKKTEFQTHYLIHHARQVYDISLVTVSKKFEENYNATFEKMIESFDFL